MPVQLTRSRSTGAIYINHTCEVCGTNAAFGYDCHPRAGIALVLDGQREAGYAKLGRWYCGQHRPGKQPGPDQTSLF